MRIGFMQGRLSPLVDGKIQAFPAAHWRDEFALAERYGFPLIEWTLDHDDLADNPLMTAAGRREIAALTQRHGIAIRSLTGDCFMQAPFFKAEGQARVTLVDELRRVLDAAAAARIAFVVVPLVDNGHLDNPVQLERLTQVLDGLQTFLRDARMKIIFESDLPPRELRGFIARFSRFCFGINYDIGNSASLGHDPSEEIASYAAWIDNVHVKDRRLGGTTTPLGTGNANLPRVFELLHDAGYRGDFILQTARAADGDHAGVLCRYRDQVRGWLADWV